MFLPITILQPIYGATISQNCNLSTRVLQQGRRNGRIIQQCNVFCAGVCRKPSLRALAPFSVFALYRQTPNYGLVLACFSLSCNPGAINLSRVNVAFYMESENSPQAPSYQPYSCSYPFDFNRHSYSCINVEIESLTIHLSKTEMLF